MSKSAYKILSFLVILSAICFPCSSQAQSYDINTHYEQAVPNFLQAVEESIQDVENKEEIVEWAESFSMRLPEFLDDMIDLSEELANQGVGEYSFKPAEDFADKWKGIVSTCPDCHILVPLVSPLVKELMKDLPELRAPKAGDVPLANYYEFFKGMYELNPWGIGGYFQVVPLENLVKNLEIKESMRHTRSEGVEEKFVIDRKTRQLEGNRLKFLEWIENDEVKKLFFKTKPTILHEAIAQMKLYYENQLFIDFWEGIVAVLDEELQVAIAAGDIDEFTYYYLFYRWPIENELVHVYHPLMKYPRVKDYKAAEFYPRTFINEQYGQWEEFAQIQIIIPISSDQIRKAEQTIKMAEDYSDTTQKITGVWILGVLVPAYAFVLFSTAKKFIWL